MEWSKHINVEHKRDFLKYLKIWLKDSSRVRLPGYFPSLSIGIFVQNLS